jgi:transglutaminase-like putative cysteine protease
MKRIFSILILVLIVSIVKAQYDVSLIPKDLMQNANVVVRKDIGEFKILSVNKAQFKVQHAVTILNEKGKDHSMFQVAYDKLRSIRDIDINVYDQFGKKIRTVKKSELTDMSFSSSSTLFDDSRIIWIGLSRNTYPFTVEYSYTVDYKYLFQIPSWYFISDTKMSVENSVFSLEFPAGLEARYTEQNYSGEKSEETLSGGIKKIQWKLTNSTPISSEPYSQSMRDIFPAVHSAPSRFEFSGYSGDMSTWDGFANWIANLNKGLDELPPATVEKLRLMTDGLSESDKIRAVYEYLQKNTRYVSIQLGIGGFQPFPATTVDKTGYGDCKALSYYTHALLKHIGIKSHYALVYAGPNPKPLSKDFSASRFNHAILCVPTARDTVWLECTSQTNPFNYLGSFTGNREVLLITEDGGKIVKTPSYLVNENIQNTNAVVSILANGDAMTNSTSMFQGIKSEYRGIGDVLTLGNEKKKKWIEDNVKIPSFDILNYSMKRLDGTADIQLNMELAVGKLGSLSGDRMFIVPNLLNKRGFVPEKNDNRQYEIVQDYGFQEHDVIIFNLPTGYRVEAFFDPVLIKSQFGEYYASVGSDEEGKFTYTRKYILYNGVFPASSYQEYIKFFKEIVAADNRKLSLIKRT